MVQTDRGVKVSRPDWSRVISKNLLLASVLASRSTFRLLHVARYAPSPTAPGLLFGTEVASSARFPFEI